MIILIKTIKEHHKLSFETICIDIWSFWGFLVAKGGWKEGQTEAQNYKKKYNLKL